MWRVSAALPFIVVSLVLSSWTSTPTLDAQEATPAAPAVTGDAEIEYLVSTPGLEAAGDVGIEMMRITYPPGATFNVEAPSEPVVYYVERGTLAVQYRLDGTMSIGYTGPDLNPAPLRATKEGETIFPAGYSIVFGNGQLEPTRNPGNEETVVLLVGLSSPQLRPPGITLGDETTVVSEESKRPPRQERIRNRDRDKESEQDNDGQGS